ncbi:glycosyltransferase [Acetobacter conturbans]|uniref:Glycosyltransferase n=1 Tax=Acetobacter conturbans TaxID=1737472 RepID=A0ABX0K4E5_9PROT|nr:glycosyltransferase family 2 protein [Acetobacter conturbans]NHN89518.1 glycosyltransferase [Acetobacter conturbans]
MRKSVDRLVFAAALLPLALTVSNFFRLRPSPAKGPRAALSVLIPARNEANTIRGAIEAVLKSHDITIELLVFDDHSTDGTMEILRSCHDPRLRILSSAALPKGWCGKTHACAQLAAAAQHDLMLFVDADVRLNPDALNRLCRLMAAHPNVALLSGVPRQITATFLEWLLLPFIHVLLLGYLPMWLDSGRRPAFAAACGQLIMVRREAYHVSGGHTGIKARLHDGLALARQFRRSGQKTMLFDASTIASCRMYQNASEVWNGLLKNASEGIATPKGLPIWTVLIGAGQVLPFLMRWTPLSLAAMAMTLLTRSLIALRFRQGWKTVLLSPVGAATLLILQWQALLGHCLGHAPQWRGRSYPRRTS